MATRSIAPAAASANKVIIQVVLYYIALTILGNLDGFKISREELVC